MFDPFLYSGGFGFGATLPGELSTFITIALIVAIIAVLFAARRDEDRSGVRPVARYLSAIGLLTLFITLFAGFGTVSALTDLVVDHQARFDDYSDYYEGDEFTIEGEGTYIPVLFPLYDFSTETTNNGNYAVAVASGLVTFTTGAIFFFHRRSRRRLLDGRGSDDGLTRVDRTYHAGRCFVSALTIAVALTGAGFGVFEIAAPGIAIGGNAKVVRGEGMSELMSFTVLALAAALVFLRSWNQLSPALGRSRSRTR